MRFIAKLRALQNDQEVPSISLVASMFKIKHLFVGLGDLFLDSEGSDDDDDDEDYVDSEQGEQDCEYPESEPESGSSSIISGDEDEPKAGAEDTCRRSFGNDEKAEEDNNAETDDVEAKIIKAELEDDAQWLSWDFGYMGSMMTSTRLRTTTSNLPFHIRDEYATVESQCLETLHELLSSPFCSENLESLSLFVGFKLPIDLKDFIPPLKRLEGLAVYSKSSVSWGDFITHNPVFSPQPPLILPGTPSADEEEPTGRTPLWSSLWTLRMAGKWIDAMCLQKIWMENLLSFWKIHTPNLERVHVSSPSLNLNLSDNNRFPAVICDVAAEALQNSRLQVPLNGIFEFDQSRQKLLVLDLEQNSDLDLWVEEWQKGDFE
ncbi:hypothetical protein AX16_006393 [Volvariella volvacea WC 439]|nr:hypothetical protein AX16_006393 [Volvariella volvacea WC 439]